MDTDRVSRWLSIGANLAVLASIVFLAVEIRQNTEMTRAQITLGRSQNTLDLASAQFNSDYIPEILVKVSDGEDLTRTELYRYRTHLRALLRIYDNDLQQQNMGLLGDHISRNIPKIIDNWIVRNPLGRDFWARNKASFSDEFVEFVDAEIAEKAEAGADEGIGTNESPQSAAEAFLTLIDQDNYQESWTEASAWLRKNVDAAQWAEHAGRSRQPLGIVTSREFKSVEFEDSLEDMPAGKYAFVFFSTTLSNDRSVSEMVGLMLEDDSSWRVIGYQTH